MISALPFISQHQRANWRQGTRHFAILKRSEGIVDRCGPLWAVVGCCGHDFETSSIILPTEGCSLQPSAAIIPK